MVRHETVPAVADCQLALAPKRTKSDRSARSDQAETPTIGENPHGSRSQKIAVMNGPAWCTMAGLCAAETAAWTFSVEPQTTAP
ncbi:hypothetical protein B0G57_102298 [Trinickia symbiotica]|nr:hypothetical protein B0G57_102298 [Trinickia symbiotica]